MGSMAQISTKSVAVSSAPRVSTKNAWARYVRNRWNGLNLVKMAMAEWGLTEGQAKGLVYAQASQSTIDAVLESLPVLSAYRLELEIMAIKTALSLETYLQCEAEDARNARAAHEARERTVERLEALARARLSNRSFLDGSDAR